MMILGRRYTVLKLILPLAIVLLTTISVGVVSGFTASQSSNANFSISAATGSLAPGDTVQISVQFNAGATPISAAQAYLNFDASVLQVVNASGSPTSSVTQGPIFTSNNWTVLQNSVNNNSGTINFAGGKNPTSGTDVTGPATLATFFFEAQTATSGTNISFATAVPRRTRAVSGFNDVTGTLTGTSLIVVSANAVAFNFSIQGRSAGGPGWTMPVTVEVYAPGTDSLVTSANMVSATSNNSASAVTLPSVAAGTYDVWFKGNNTLAKLVTNAPVSSSAPAVNVGEVTGGDATGGGGGAADNVVDAADYSAFLNIPIGTATGTLPEVQERQDHNRDGVIDIIDYAVIVENFGMVGAARP